MIHQNPLQPACSVTEPKPAPSWRAPLVAACLLGAGLAPSASAALNPSQQAIFNYITNSSVCGGSGGGGGGGDIGDIGSISDGALSRGLAVAPAADLGTQLNCNRGNGAANVFWDDIERLDDVDISQEQLEQILQGFAYEETTTQGTLHVEVAGSQAANIAARIAELRSGSLGLRRAAAPQRNRRTLALDHKTLPQGLNGGAAGSGDSRLGFFFNGRLDTGDKDATSTETGFDFDGFGLTAGMDYRVTDSTVLGAAIGFGKTEADYQFNAGDMDVDGYTLSLYGTHYAGAQFYVDGILSYSNNKFESTRRFTTAGGDALTAVGDTDGNVLNAGVGAGWEIQSGATTFGPYIRFNYTEVDIDEFRESGASFWGMAIDGQELESVNGVLGIQFTHALSQSWGVLLPHARLEWVHEFENERRIINARFLGAVQSNTGLTPILQPTDDPDQDYFNIAVGLSAQFGSGAAAFVQYEGVAGLDTINEHALEFGVRFDY